MVSNTDGTDSPISRTPASRTPLLDDPPSSLSTIIDTPSTIDVISPRVTQKRSDEQDYNTSTTTTTNNNNNNKRRRRNKVTYSCLPCRKRRVRCDRGKPACNSCLKYTAGSLKCTYADEGIKQNLKNEFTNEINESPDLNDLNNNRSENFESNSNNNTDYSYNSNEDISRTRSPLSFSSSFKKDEFHLNPNENDNDQFFNNDGNFSPITNHDSIFENLNPIYKTVKESLKAPCFNFKSDKIRTRIIYHQPGKTKFFGLLSFASFFRFQPEIFLIWKMSEGFYINEKKNWKNNKILTSLNDLSFLRIRSEIEDENNKKFHDYIESFLPNWIIFEKAIVYFYNHLSFFYDFIELKYLEQVFKTRFKKDELTGKTLIIDPEKANYSEIALVLSIYYLVRRILSENGIGINDENDIKEGDSKETKNDDDVEKINTN
ncbi:unnamed protein product [[Candida] boidinii]|uniref:Unnamed protein product n=1 Tax=Candida boidinii TaxID=5477 RepID=A0ACB5U2I8_CANBO|nr:unnamed protein product [[Candida] boidinii]